MDPALLKERESFLRKSRLLPVVERPKQLPPEPISTYTLCNTQSRRPNVSTSSINELRALEVRQQPQGKFAVLSRIVKYMKQRHLDRDVHPLSVDEILEEAIIHDVPASTLKWLEEEALPNNPKIRITEDRKFVFRPRYEVRNRQELYNLIRRHELKGMGGIYLDDLAESVPEVEKVLSSFGDHVIRIVTPHDKKTIIYYNDKSFDLNVDDEFKQQWRAVSVEGVHETKIEEYLKRNGISSMSGERKTFIPIQRKKPGQKRTNRPIKFKDNEHVNSILEDFSEKVGKNS